MYPSTYTANNESRIIKFKAMLSVQTVFHSHVTRDLVRPDLTSVLPSAILDLPPVPSKIVPKWPDLIAFLHVHERV